MPNFDPRTRSQNLHVRFSIHVIFSVLLLVYRVGIQNRPEDHVPELGGDTEAKLVILVVVLEMVLLQLLHVLGKLCVVQHEMRGVIHNITQEATGKPGAGIVVRQQREHQLIDWVGQHHE